MSESAEERTPVTEVVDTALGRRERPDPVLPGTGGPAGNAVLTAWLGLVLLVLFFLEGLTLLDVRGLMTWHVALGALLVPPAVAKTATTGWRIVRYYSGQRAYRAAGPPPLLLRLLGPLVVATTFVLLGSGVALILLGEESSRQPVLGSLGLGVDWVGLHKGVFVAWFAAMAAHVLARALPAFRLTTTRGTPGLAQRVVALTLALVVAAGAAVWLVGGQGSWGNRRAGDRGEDHVGTARER